ncbi:MAG TPA: hypothetical protein VL987_02495 [Cellvibrio sp.]|jgi:hypothetical protein|nr:hypothetical protein [Cellvibrio sp.]
MQMKKMIAIAGLTMAMPLAAFADDDAIKALNLQGAKADQVKTIMDNYKEQKEDIKDRAHEEIKALKDRKKEQLDAVLTDAEMDQLEKWKEARHDRYKDKHKECKKLMDKYDD